MPALYQVVDAVGGFVNTSFPYSRRFNGNGSFSFDPMLFLWVKTGYSSNASAASVRVNGTEIGKIFPRPWLTHSFIDLEAESFVFSRSVLDSVPFPWWPGFNVLEIVPVAGAANFVLIGNVIFFRNS
jgi:hypothetical protein